MDKREIEFIHSNEAQGNHFKYNLKSPSTGKIGRNGYILKLNFLGSQNRSRKGNQNEAHYFFQLSLFFFACSLLANSQNPSLANEYKTPSPTILGKNKRANCLVIY